MPLIIKPSKDNKPVFSDLDPKMTRNPKTGDLLSIKDDSAIRLALKNLISTSFGERLFQPNIGCSLRYLLFEPIDHITTFEVRDRVFQTIRNHEPRVSDVIVDVAAFPDQNEYIISVQYSVVAIGNTDKITVTLERIR